MPKPDYRSSAAAEYRKLYNLPIWRGKHGLRARQLTKQPLCERCKKAGHITIATVVNHRTPHKGDMNIFADPANLESTCKPHHDGDIQAEEHHGFSTAIGADGWPTDDRHPANRVDT